jgi:hypothetical protein
MPQSIHPMDQTDRQLILQLLETRSPANIDIVNAARLTTRYRDSLLSPDLYKLLQQVARNWTTTLVDIQERSRAIWLSGWKPADHAAELQGVGSGADVES